MLRFTMLFIFFVNIPTTNATVITQGLVHHWTADGNTLDSVGSRDGTLQFNAGYAEGVFGEAFSLDGSDDSVRLPNVSGLDPFTMSAWFNFNSLSGRGRQYIFQTGMGAISLTNDLSGVDFNVFQNRQGISASQETYFNIFQNMINAGEWFHVALTATADNSEIFAYLNGEQLGSLNFQRTGLGANHNFSRIGINHVNDGVRSRNLYSFNGLIDDVSIYNRALADTEVLSMYQEGNAPVVISEPSNLFIVFLGIFLLHCIGREASHRFFDMPREIVRTST